MTVFWDTNLFIYLIERHPLLHDKVLALYHHQRERGERLLTSTLTLGELLAQPLRLGRSDLARSYAQLLTTGSAIELIPFDHRAAEHYAAIRAHTTLRQPDAIQLACAVTGGAKTFVTNDQRLWGLRVPGLEDIRGL